MQFPKVTKHATVALFCAALVVCPDVRAQSQLLRFEIGGQLSVLNANVGDPSLVSTDSTGFDRVTFAGGGGRFTFNLTNAIGFEVEGNAFREQNLTYELVAGVKAGLRREHFGLYGKARPGFAHFLHVSDTGPNCVDQSKCGTFGRNEFALDLGGVFEYYPARRVTVRVDVGDTIIRIGNRGGFGRVPDPTQGGVGPITIPANVTNNFQFSIGASFRF